MEDGPVVHIATVDEKNSGLQDRCVDVLKYNWELGLPPDEL